MKIHANVQVKNEEILLNEIYNIWKDYPVDKWVFYNDNSTDQTEDFIKGAFGDKAVIINDNLPRFHESHQRSRMLEYSREEGADFAIAIDCDELMSTHMLENIEDLLTSNKQYDIQYYWFNVVGSLNKIRQDNAYRNNYRTFVMPIAKTGQFNKDLWKYHTPRTPPIDLQKVYCEDAGFIHLQSVNVKFYALKQLWYKHHEFHKYGHTVAEINNRYDPVVNNLNFEEIDTPPNVVDGISFNVSIFDDICESKGYKKYIEDNYIEDLITFGREYLV
jgi:hypothetical protein